jgi:hypothetical protein
MTTVPNDVGAGNGATALSFHMETPGRALRLTSFVRSLEHSKALTSQA